MHIDCRAVNRIMLKYRFPILYLDDKFDLVARLTLFVKIQSESSHHIFHHEMRNKLNLKLMMDYMSGK